MLNERIKKIETALKYAFPDCALEIIDNSHLHAGHAGAKTGKGHFKVRINADELKNKSRVQQHRLIYRALSDLFETDIHALEIERPDD